MSSRGWPKGKPRGPLTPKRAGELKAAGARYRRARRLRQAGIARGNSQFGPDLQFAKQAGSVNISPAAFRSALTFVDDYEFIEDGLDECLVRALREGVVYAVSVGHHHEPPFQDVTIQTIAATERHHRKLEKKYGLRRRRLPLPTKRARKKPFPAPMARTGTSLTAVVDEMFSDGKAKPLLAVVSELFDS